MSGSREQRNNATTQQQPTQPAGRVSGTIPPGYYGGQTPPPAGPQGGPPPPTYPQGG